MKSSLTEEELKLVSAIFSEKFNPIRNEFDKEEKQIQWSETSNSLPKYTDWLSRFARANISIKVDCYVEVFKKSNKFPNNNDLVEIQTLLLRIKDRFVKKLSEYFSNPFSENFSKSTVEATTYTFSEELKQYISLASAPLYRLNAEGKVLMTMNTREEIPVEIKERLTRFQKDYPDQSKTAFIMMRFADTKTHNEIASAIKDILSKNDIKGLRADDKQYHTDLLPNILTYVYGCKFGIAVFERIEARANASKIVKL